MDRRRLMQLGLAAALNALVAGAHAQYRVSEIIAKGGQVMTADQVRTEIVDRTIEGTNDSGLQFAIKLNGDGTLEGTAYTPRGPLGVTGSWTLNPRNQICSEVAFTAGGNAVKRCVWYWKAGDDYYSTNSHLDDSAAATFVECLMSGGKDCDGSFALAKRSVRK